MTDTAVTLVTQLAQSTSLIILADKLSQDVFTRTDNNTNFEIVEDKKRNIKTKVQLESLRGSLNQFDKMTLYAILSEYVAGNEIIPIRRLWQKMGGSHTLTKAMEKVVRDSIEKLACTRLKVDMTDLNYEYCLAKDYYLEINNYLLPCKQVRGKINGQVICDVVQVIDKSPLLEIAELKKQLITCDSDMLDVPKLRNTESVLKIKSYLIERIAVILGSHKPHKKHFCGKGKGGVLQFKGAKKLNKIILLDTLFGRCDLSDTDRWQKREIRNTIEKIMNHFKEKNLISEWHFEKKNGAIYSIQFEE